MTNEEIIKRGGDNIAETLWNNNLGFIRLKIRERVTHNIKNDSGNADELYKDLMQCSYFAVVDALKLFNPQRGMFITLLGYCLKKCFNEWHAACSGWSVSLYREVPKNNISVDSLNRIIFENGEGNDTELEAVLGYEDEKIESIVQDIYIQDLHAALERLLGRINKKEADIIRLRYFKNKSLKEIALLTQMKYSVVKYYFERGMTKLRQLAIHSELRAYIDIRTDNYTHIGIRTFQRTGISSVEQIVLNRAFNKW